MEEYTVQQRPAQKREKRERETLNIDKIVWHQQNLIRFIGNKARPSHISVCSRPFIFHTYKNITIIIIIMVLTLYTMYVYV